MSGRIQHHQLASRKMGMNVLSHRERRDGIVRALQDECWGSHPGEVEPIVRQEGDPGKVTRDRGISPAEAAGELRGQLGAIGISHDDRSHGRGPAHVVGLEKLQELVDVSPLEATQVRVIVDVAPMSTSRSKRSGSRSAASTPIMALTEWPTKITLDKPSAAQISSTSDA
jgi:hypothetical protein